MQDSRPSGNDLTPDYRCPGAVVGARASLRDPGHALIDGVRPGASPTNLEVLNTPERRGTAPQRGHYSVPRVGFEPTTLGLEVLCSIQAELPGHKGIVNEILGLCPPIAMGK